MNAPVVDVHAHVVLPQLQEFVVRVDPDGFQAHQELDARRNGPESLKNSGPMIRDRIPQLTDPTRRLADMDAAGVDIQLVSPSPSHYYPFLAREHAVEVARLANEAMKSLVERSPGRVLGLGLAPLQHPEEAVRALEHAVLECGLRGVEISSYGPGSGSEHTVELSDDRLEPFWARAAGLGAIVFLHPFGCSLDERLDRFYLANTVGQPVENAVALSHLIFAGVLDRHPTLTLLAAHGGGYLPTFLGRSDHAWEVRGEAKIPLQKPSTYIRKLYFDSLVHTPEALRSLVASAGSDRVLMGSDYPFDMGVTDPVQRVLAAGLPGAEADSILGGTAAALGLHRA
ncbi:amidohydrolase family protein [Subtercola sp. YIM 133946]|uniref:amidohydrolase family protein n=1 Tax=Subtercola sp. YIM 133946 TaxID=3118909 RepID=UPI002F92A4B3